MNKRMVIKSDVRESQAWLDKLSTSQMNELVNLEMNWRKTKITSGDGNFFVKIIKDWIDDNGGDRSWWEHLMINY
jgi:hypothetical protein